MVSERKLNVNRLNALKSTGPKSEQGKAAVARNATRHGLYSSQALLDGDDPAEFESLREKLFADLRPGGAMQTILVDRIVVLSWRLRRIGQIEAAMIGITNETWDEANDRRRRKHLPVAPAERIAEHFLAGGAFDALSQYEQRLQRSLQAALRQLMQMKKQEVGEDQDEHQSVEVNRDAQRSESADVETNAKSQASGAAESQSTMVVGSKATVSSITTDSEIGHALEFAAVAPSAVIASTASGLPISRSLKRNLRNKPNNSPNYRPGQPVRAQDLRHDRPSVQSPALKLLATGN